MSQKQNVEVFLKKYMLKDTINAAKITTDESNISVVHEISTDRNMIAHIEWYNTLFPQGQLAIYTSDQLLKLLSLYNDDHDFQMKFISKEDKIFSVVLTGSNSSVTTYMLAMPEVIPDANHIKHIDNWNILFSLNEEEIKLFLKAKNALSDAELFFVDNQKVFIGKSEYGSNKVEFSIVDYITRTEISDALKFNLNYFSEILSVSPEGVRCSLIDSNGKGLLKVEWEDTEKQMNAIYYLSSIQV